MNEEQKDILDYEWQQRAARIDSDILREFPVTLMDQKVLQQVIKQLKPRMKLFSFFEEFEFYDDELLIFLEENLKDHNWKQIDWEEHNQVIPLMFGPVYTYCLPGIIRGILYDSFNFDVTIVSETFIVSFLYPTIVQADVERFDFNSLTSKQQKIVFDVVVLLRDLMFFDNPQIQEMANEIICACPDSLKGSETTETKRENGRD